jgi:hypothetical protein
MKAVRATIPTSEVARSPGITTGNYMLKEGFRPHFSNGPRLQAYDPEPVQPQLPEKMISVIYNEGKCYNCGARDFEPMNTYFAGHMGKCRKCNTNFVLSSKISQTEYEAKFGLKK